MYQELIEKRKRADWYMQLAIIQNPHTEDPNKLAEELDPNRHDYLEAELDKGSFATFKSRLSASKAVKVE